MIEIEDQVYAIQVDALREVYQDDIAIYGEYVATPAKFPAVTIVQGASEAYVPTQTNNPENHARIMFEVSVYSNKLNGKKSECKAIIKIIDDVFNALGFTRIFLDPIPNLGDPSIYRMVGRYQAVVSASQHIF